MAVEKKDDEPGVVIKKVLAKSAAESAGVQVGDRLLTLDDRWTDTVADCYTAAGYAKAGTATTIRINSQGKEMELTVTPDSGL